MDVYRTIDNSADIYQLQEKLQPHQQMLLNTLELVSPSPENRKLVSVFDGIGSFDLCRSLASQIYILDSRIRTGWHKDEVGVPYDDNESVAKHTVHLARQALKFFDSLNQESIKLNQYTSTDEIRRKIVVMSLVHDIGEIPGGDVPIEPEKESLKSENEKRLETERKESKELAYINEVFTDIKGIKSEAVDAFESFKNYQDSDDIAALVVRSFDKIQMAKKAKSYAVKYGIRQIAKLDENIGEEVDVSQFFSNARSSIASYCSDINFEGDDYIKSELMKELNNTIGYIN